MKRKFLLCLFLILFPVVVFAGAQFSRIKIWTTGQIPTASELNAEFNNILVNLVPAGIGTNSTTVVAFEATKDPYPGGVESLPVSLKEELQELKFQIQQITGRDKWEKDPEINLNTLYTETPPTNKSFKNLLIKVNTINPTYQIDVTADYLDVTSVGGVDKRINNVNETIDITVSGIGGLETGKTEIANATYAIHVLYNSTTDTTNCILVSNWSAYYTGSYDYDRIIGFVRNDSGSNFIAFVQQDNLLLYLSPSADTTVLNNGAATTFTSLNCLSFTGDYSLCKIIIAGVYLDGTTTSNNATIQASLRSGRIASGNGIIVGQIIIPDAATDNCSYATGEFYIELSATQTISYILAVTGTPTGRLDINIAGCILNL